MGYLTFSELLDLKNKRVQINLNGDWVKGRVKVSPSYGMDGDGNLIAGQCVQIKGVYKDFSFFTNPIFCNDDAKGYETKI